jgi:hypothetical protein
MRAGRLSPARPQMKSADAVILFWVGPYRMGIPAASLKEIRSDCCPASQGDLGLPPEELGCDAIVSAGALLGMTAETGGRLLVLRAGNVGVRVDRVERMIEIGKLHPLPRAFQGAERSWYSGITLAGELVIPLLNPETLAREAISPAGERPATGCETLRPAEKAAP